MSISRSWLTTFAPMGPLRDLLLIALFLCACPLLAQEGLTGTIDYPQLGITVTLPEGWVANEGDGSIFIGSQTTPGLILLSVHEFGGAEDLIKSVGSGFSEDGMELFPADVPRLVKEDLAVVEYAGQIEGQPAKGSGAARFNPYGNSVAIIAVGLEKTWDPELPATALRIAEGLEFRLPPRTGPSAEQWERHLTNVRLTRMENRPTPPDQDTVTINITSIKRIDLCGDGRFTLSGTTDMVTHDDRSLNEISRGQWDVLEDPRGSVLLRLDHGDGRRSEYELEEQDGRTYLDGKRWFRTWDGEQAPDCMKVPERPTTGRSKNE